MSRKATFFRIAGIDSVAIWIFPEKSHADKSNAKWETFVRFYQVFQFFQIFIIYAQRELHIWTPPLNSALKITLVWKFWAAEVVEAKECPAILVCIIYVHGIYIFFLNTNFQVVMIDAWNKVGSQRRSRT